MRSILVTLLAVVAVAAAAPSNGAKRIMRNAASPTTGRRMERQVVVTDPQNYASLLYINSASGLTRSTNTSGSPVFELILYPANPSPPTPKTAVAVLGGGDAVGTLTLTQAAPPTGSVHIEGVISNLTPGLHGFHIHDKGSLKDGCISAGGHYNPYMRNHGSPKHIERHVGDLGNIIADQNGVAHVNITDELVTLVGPRSVIGRAIVVHAGEDDLGAGGHPTSLKTGNAGGRVGCGAIGVA